MKDRDESTALTQEWQAWTGAGEASAVFRELSSARAEAWQLRLSPTEQRDLRERFPADRRRWEWLESRQCEVELRAALLRPNTDASRLRLSLTHSRWGEFSRVAAIGWVPPEGGGILGIGVDLESSHREVDPRLAERLITEPESGFKGLGLLEHWVIKEACFKATPDNAGQVVTGYRIIAYDPVGHSGKVKAPGLSQDLVCAFKLLRGADWVLALAITRDISLAEESGNPYP